MFSFKINDTGVININHTPTDYDFQYTQSPTSNCQLGTLSCMGDFLDLVENSGDVVKKLTARQVPSLTQLLNEARKQKIYVQNMLLVDVQARYIDKLLIHLKECSLDVVCKKPYTSTNGSKMVLVMFKTH